MQGENIVCFANDWQSDPTSKHQVMKILSRTNKVLWVNSIGLRRPAATVHDVNRIMRKVRQFCQGPVAISPNMRVLTPLVIPFHGLPGSQTLNELLISRYVRAHARKFGMDHFQLWSFLPTTAPLVRHLKPDKVIYYCVDEWSAFTYLDGRLMRNLENSMIAQSNLVITSAEALYQSKQHLHPHTYLVPHGVDSEHFAGVRSQATEVAPELKDLPRPVIGFWGLIHEWIDFELLEHVAKRHPEWSLVLIGKTDVDCATLRKLPNVHFVGQRQYSSLPGYAKGFTAAILPFKMNRLTENVNPIKLQEYLAAGLPVVSTALPEVKKYASVVRIAATADEFVKMLEAAILDTGEVAVKRRMEAVCKETWLGRVEHISTLIENIFGNGRRVDYG